MQWQPIATRPPGDHELIVGVDIATVWIVRSAWWDEGDDWQERGYDDQDQARGWWSYKHSVTQEKLEGIYQPTHWLMQTPKPPVQ